MSDDGKAGFAGIDDDADGSIDEGSVNDDDEDGQSDEERYEVVAFYLQGNQLVERTPVPWDEDGMSNVDGRDYVESIVAENVTRFRVERMPDAATRFQLVELTLELTSSAGETISVSTSVRLGSAP